MSHFRVPRRLNLVPSGQVKKFLLLLGLLPFAWAVPVSAQSITPAINSTGTVVLQNGGSYTIQGGQLSGDRTNLFHSFERFGLNANEAATFLSNPAIRNILGRVGGGDPSIIQGLIQVTGGNSNLYLINPAGILFGANASLNVPASFTATTANGIGFSNGQWWNGTGTPNYAALVGTPEAFAFGHSQPGAIVNLGNLAVGQGQSLTLLGGTVLNTGQLTAPGGQITIAAVPGENLVRLSQSGSLLSLEVTPLNAVSSNLPAPATLPQLLTGGNGGNATGITVNADGTVQLTGSNLQTPTVPGTAIVRGQLSVASNVPAAQPQIAILGDRVSLQSANLDASGSNGGTVRIGGDYQGQGTVPNARFTHVDANSVIRADAIATGNGGRVIVWADDTTNFAGTITARGGNNGGNGGLVETSGKQTLNVAGARVDASAAQGLAGTWLLDPSDITINAALAGTINTSLNGGTSVNLTTVGGTGGNGDILLQNPINKTANNAANLTLTASRYLTPSGGATINLASGNLTLNVNQEALAVTTFPTIQNAIDAIGTVATVPTINLGAGTYTLNSTVNINKSLTLNGISPASTTISGNNTVRVFTINAPNVTLSGLTIANGSVTGNGGGILQTGTGSLTVINSVFQNNQAIGASGGGGQIATPFNPGLGGTVNGFGGAIYTQGTLNIANSTFSGNVAQGGAGGANFSFGSGGGGGGAGLGGAIFNDGGAVAIAASTFTTNRAVGGSGGNGGPGFGGAGNGGGGSGGNGGTAGGNGTGGNGGAGNFGGGGGSGGAGGMFGGSGGSGGAGSFGGGGGGGGAFNGAGGGAGFGAGSGGSNVGPFSDGGGGGGGAGMGGAVFSRGGTVQIRNSTFDSNQALGGNGGAASLTGNTQGGNGGSGLGGAIFNEGATFNLLNNTLTSNQTTGGSGGTLYGGGTVRATPGNPGTGLGGGIFNRTGTVNLGNTIVSGNIAATDPDISGTIVSQGFNLIGNTTGGSGFVATDLQNVNPLLAPLGNYGGPTQTMALLPGSPAINAANPSTTTPDQRGFGPVGVRDIGAYESVGFTLTPASGNNQRTIVSTAFPNTLAVTLTETGSNRPLPGVAIQFNAPASGASASLSSTTAITDSNGQATISVAANTNPGTYTVTAGLPGVPTAVFNLTNEPPPPIGLVLTPAGGNSQRTIVNTAFSNALVVTLTEAGTNRPLAGVSIQFTVPNQGASASLSSTTVTTDSNGQASVAATANPDPGFYRITASLPGAANVEFDLTNEPPAPISRNVQQDPTPPVPPPPTVNLPVVSTVGTTFDAVEDGVTNQFTNHLDLPEKPRAVTLPQSQDTLRQIATASGVRPALLYVMLAPRSEDQNLSREPNTQPELSWDPVTGNPVIRQVPATTSDLQLLLVTPNGNPIYRPVRNVSREMVIQVAKEFRNEVSDPSKIRTDSYLPAAQQLYKWLIAPIAADLKAQRIGSISFIMDTPLRFIPLAALHDGKQFLVEQYSIGLMPSLSLTDIRYGNLRTAQVLGAGASTFTDPTQNALPAVQKEIAAILSAKDRWQGIQLLEERFTRSNLLAERQAQPFGIIHLATHGEFVPGKISESYIQLKDEKLRLDQLRQLKWNDPPAELVVLSACRMAVGNEDAELGFAGFAVKAGVKSVLASLWNVSDEGTMGLMTEFYQQLWQSPVKAEALRRAQLALLQGKVTLRQGKLIGSNGTVDLPPELAKLGTKELVHPYFWSAFTIVGSPW